MKKLVKAVRKDYRAKNDNESDIERFEAVVGELGRESFLASEASISEPSWDLHALMRKEKAKYDYV